MNYKNIRRKPIIVAIDDSPMILNFLKSYLSDSNEVITYQSTSTALEELSSGLVAPDCVVTDYYLGKDLTGLEFTMELKKVDPIIPVMILSGSCDTGQKIACLEQGAIDFMVKPFNPKELKARIRNALSTAPQVNGYFHAL